VRSHENVLFRKRIEWGAPKGEVCRFSVVTERKFVFKIRSKFGKP